MDIQSSILRFIVLLIPVLSVIYITVGINLSKGKGERKINYFSMMLFACAIYSFGYFLELTSVSVEAFVIVRNFEFLGAVFIPTFGILFIAQLTAMKITKKALGILFSISMILWLMFITNPLHDLVYRSLQVQIIHGFAVPVTEKGAGFYFIMAYYAMLLIFSSIALARAYQSSGKKNDKSSFRFLFITFQIPWFAMLIILFGFDKYVDPVPATIMVICGLFMVNEIKNDMFKLLLGKWGNYYANVEEQALLVDSDGTLVCSNEAAQELLEVQEMDIEKIIAALDASKLNHTPVSFTIQEEIRWFAVHQNNYDSKGYYKTYLLIDITEQQLAKASILKSESRHKAMIAGSSEVVGIMGIDGILKYNSPNIEKCFGWLPEDLIGTEGLKVVHPDDAEWLREEFRTRLWEEHAPITVQCRYKCKEGGYKWIELVATNLVNDEAINGILLNYHDITDRKRTEEALKESENSKSLLLSNLPGMAYRCLYDENWTMTFVSKGCYELTGYTESELLNNGVLSYKDLIFPEYNDYLWNAWAEAVSTKNPLGVRVEYRILTADNTEKWVWEQGNPVYDAKGEIQALEGLLIDITDRKNMEHQLYNEKEQFKATLISVGDGVISTDTQGNVLIMNRVSEQLTGWNHEEAVGRPMEEVFHIIHEQTRERAENPVAKVLASGETVEIAKRTLLLSKDGTERHIEDSAAPIIDEQGNIAGVVLVFRDFTEKKKHQDEVNYLSFHDHLTGMYNRRFYEAELARLDHKRNWPLTIVMGDVNGLKLINDSFGHAVGDQLLQKTAEAVKSACRADDIIARIGGDEFVILLPKTDGMEAAELIKRIKALLKQEKVGDLEISVSFGHETKTSEEEDMQVIFKKAEDAMYHIKLFEGPSIKGKVIDNIIRALNSKSKREEVHSRRVSELCERMGTAIGLEEYKINELKALGLLHDIGKIAISDTILNKPDALTENEWIEMKNHSEIGYRILNTNNDMSDVADYVLFHHERWDGNGYPKGLKGEAIPLPSRICAIADAYDAMINVRSYKSFLTKEVALAELRNNAGIQFDPKLVTIFIEKVISEV